MEKRNYGSAKRSYNKKETTNSKKYGGTESRKDESTDTRKFEGELRPLMTEEENGRNHGKTETRKHEVNELRKRVRGFGSP